MGILYLENPGYGSLIEDRVLCGLMEIPMNKRTNNGHVGDSGSAGIGDGGHSCLGHIGRLPVKGDISDGWGGGTSSGHIDSGTRI